MVSGKISDADLANHKVVSQDEWIKASAELLVKEKALSRERDELAKLRRQMPWVKVDKEYVFDAPDGKKTLSELFDGRSQLAVYHFMGATGPDDFCFGCSFVSDHTDAANLHLPHHDVTLLAISRTPLPLIEAYKKRMDWKFKWLSAEHNDFTYDFGVSYRRKDLDAGPVLHNFKMQKLSGEEQPGLSVFYKDPKGDIYHTYSSYERGLDDLLGTYHWLDLTPKGRNEDSPMDWLERHDEY